MKEVTALHGHARVTVEGRIKSAIGSRQMHARRYRATGFIHNLNADEVHRRLPLLRPNRDDLLAPAIGVHYDQPRKAALIGDVRDALAVRRPAGVKIIMVAK